VRFVARIWYWFALPNASGSHKRRFYSLTAVITSLTVQLRLSIALHKLNCVQSMSW